MRPNLESREDLESLIKYSLGDALFEKDAPMVMAIIELVKFFKIEI